MPLMYDYLGYSFQVEMDRNELHSRVTSLRSMVSNLEDQVKQTSAQLSMTKDAVYEKDSDINREVLRCEQAERTAEDFQRRLTRTAGDLQASEEKNARLEERIGKRQSNPTFGARITRSSLLCSRH